MYSIAVWHGEHETLFYVIKTINSVHEDWEVIETFHSRGTALEYIDSKES